MEVLSYLDNNYNFTSSSSITARGSDGGGVRPIPPKQQGSSKKKNGIKQQGSSSKKKNGKTLGSSMFTRDALSKKKLVDVSKKKNKKKKNNKVEQDNFCDTDDIDNDNDDNWIQSFIRNNKNNNEEDESTYCSITEQDMTSFSSIDNGFDYYPVEEVEEEDHLAVAVVDDDGCPSDDDATDEASSKPPASLVANQKNPATPDGPPRLPARSASKECFEKFKNGVSFPRNDILLKTYRDCLHIKNYTPKEIKACWYNESEMDYFSSSSLLHDVEDDIISNSSLKTNIVVDYTTYEEDIINEVDDAKKTEAVITALEEYIGNCTKIEEEEEATNKAAEEEDCPIDLDDDKKEDGLKKQSLDCISSVSSIDCTTNNGSTNPKKKKLKKRKSKKRGVATKKEHHNATTTNNERATAVVSSPSTLAKPKTTIMKNEDLNRDLKQSQTRYKERNQNIGGRLSLYRMSGWIPDHVADFVCNDILRIHTIFEDT